MYTELLQLVVVLAVFAIAIVLWLRFIYLPRRTVENWEGQRVTFRKQPSRSEERSD